MPLHRGNLPRSSPPTRAVSRASGARCLRPASFLLTLVVLTAPARTALAQTQSPPAPRRLEYRRAAGAERCPDATALRAAVTARLGRDPFADDAPQTVIASVARRGRGLRAEIQLRDADGTRTGTRTIDARGTACDELAESMTLAISIAVDPLSVTRPAPPPAPAPDPRAQERTLGATLAASAPTRVNTVRDASLLAASIEPAVAITPAPPQRPAITPAPAPLTQPHAFITLGGGAAFGLSNVVAGHTALSLGYRRGAFSLALEARFDLPSSVAFPQGAMTAMGSVTSSPLLASVLGCYHVSVLALCPMVTAGVLFSSASMNLPMARSAVSFLALLGARVAVEVPIVSRLALRVRADAQYTATPTELLVGGMLAWTTWAATVTLGADLRVRF